MEWFHSYIRKMADSPLLVGSDPSAASSSSTPLAAPSIHQPTPPVTLDLTTTNGSSTKNDTADGSTSVPSPPSSIESQQRPEQIQTTDALLVRVQPADGDPEDESSTPPSPATKPIQPSAAPPSTNVNDEEEEEDDMMMRSQQDSNSPASSPTDPSSPTNHAHLMNSKSSGSILLNDSVDTIRETLSRVYLFLTFQSIQEPNARFKIFWDWFVILLAVYSYYFTSWYIAFDTDLGRRLYGFDWFVTIIFLFDILIQFRTGFVDYSANAIFDSHTIAERYLKSYFVLDLMAAFPFHIISPGIHFGPSEQFVDNVMKCNFILRASKLINSERIDAFISPQARIGKLLFGFISLAHFFGSLFFFVGSIQTSETTWIKVKGYDEKSHVEQYVASLYWALTTMVTVGYGDIVPVTTWEQATVIPILMLSALIYATIFGSMAYAIETITSTIRRYQGKMDNMKEFTKVYELPPELQQKLYDYTNAAWNQTKGFETQEMLAHLPTSVKADIMGFINRTLIERVPLFKQCSDRFLEAMILRMSSQVCLAGDYIFKEGDKSREMYFVRSGGVLIEMEFHGTDRVIAEIGSYSDYPFFGEISLLLGETRTASAKAASKCVLSKLSQQDFFEVLSMFPEEENSLRETATLRLEQDIEREAKFLAKRDRKLALQRQGTLHQQKLAAASAAAASGGGGDTGVQSNDLPAERSRSGKTSTDEGGTTPVIAPVAVDGGGGGQSRAETRLRHIEGGSGEHSHSPILSPLLSSNLLPPSPGPGPEAQVNTRLSRLNSVQVRHSLFVAHGAGGAGAAGGGVGPNGNKPGAAAAPRVSSFNSNGISPALLAHTQGNVTPTTSTPPPQAFSSPLSPGPLQPLPPPQAIVLPSASSAPTAAASSEGAIRGNQSVHASPSLNAMGSDPMRERTGSDARHSIGGHGHPGFLSQQHPYAFDHIREEDEEGSSVSGVRPGHGGGHHSRKMSVAEKYAAGALTMPSNKPGGQRELQTPPSPGGPMAHPSGLDSLAALKKSRDMSQSNLHIGTPPGHTRSGTKLGSSLARVVSRVTTLGEDGLRREQILDEKVKLMEATIERLTNQMATMLALQQMQPGAPMKLPPEVAEACKDLDGAPKSSTQNSDT